ncbi:hypothetical protein [Tomitella biformata]|uniref:hypothetical protein n=1 Tax=Tomitella biformata TaxID=630403 RepID=UPI00068833E9|nr:hypothetical protein [Tomitella biformata]
MNGHSQVSDTSTSITDPGFSGQVGRILDSPIIGLIPWVVVGVFEGPGRTSWAAAAALALSVLFVAMDLLRRRSLKILNVVDVAFFTALLVLSHVVSADGLRWLETWLGEISNITLTVVIVASILFRMPFTMQYAREQVAKQYWHTPTFMRINYAITAVWAAAFLVASIAGLIGELALQNSSNVWTNWIIQIIAILVAAEFTSWYPKVARAQSPQPDGQRAEPAPPFTEFLSPLLKMTAVVGIVSLSLSAAPVWFGVALIVVGVVGAFAIHQTESGEPARELH